MQTRFLSSILTLLMVLGLTLHYRTSWAGRVIKVKGKKVYIKLSKKEAKKLSKGDKLYLMTKKSKKKKGVVVIRKKKGRKAIAILKKGKAKKKYITRMRKRKKKGVEESMDTIDDIASVETDDKYSDLMVGFMGNFTMVEQSIASKPPVDMTGSMIGAKIVLDYSLTELFGLRVRTGMDMMKISGTDETENTSETSINYLVLDILGRFYLLRKKSFGVFINAGAGIYAPLSTDVSGNPSALDQDSIDTTALGIGGLGLYYSVSGWQIFAGFDYFYFPPSDTVETTSFGGNLGILFPF